MQVFQSELTSLKCMQIEKGSDNWYPNYNGEEPILITCQEDVGTKFRVMLTDNGEKWCPDENALLSVWYSGSSGEGNYTQIDGHSAFTITDNTLEVEIVTQMIACDGAGTLWLMLSNGDGGRKTLCKLPYITLPGPDPDSAEAQKYYTAFSELIRAADQFTTDPTLSVVNKAADAAVVGTRLGQIQAKLNALLSAGDNYIENYPTKAGIYRVTGTNIFQNMAPSAYYGILIIFEAVYAAHFYIDTYGNLYWGYSGDTFNEPSAWKKAMVSN